MKASCYVLNLTENSSTLHTFQQRPNFAKLCSATFSSLMMLPLLHTVKTSSRPFSNTCEVFRLSISLKKTKVMHQGSDATPTITIKDYTLDVVTQFTYLGSRTSNNGSLDVEIGKRIGKAATNMAKLSARVGEQETLPRLKLLSIMPVS